MKNSIRAKFARPLLVAMSLTVMMSAAVAQTPFPSKPVRLLVPSSPGSGPDQIARIVGQALSERWGGRPVVIENRSGASGQLGFDQLAKAEPDGYTLLVAAHNIVIVPALGKTSYDPLRDFAPIGRIATAGMVLGVHPSLGVNNLSEFVALVKASPGKYSYGSAGSGTTHHMMMELLKHVANLHIVHIPYRGPSPIVPDLLENRISAAFVSTPSAMAYVPSGRLKAIAVAGEMRLAQFPSTPTVAESGYKSFDPVLWYGLFAPAATASPIQSQISSDLVAVLALPKVVDALRNLGIDAAPMELGPFKDYVAKDFGRYQKLVKDTGITAE